MRCAASPASLPILRCTHEQYCAQVKAALGKGAEHALYAYQEYYRLGAIVGKHPAFANAGQLLDDIRQLTCFKLPQLVARHEEGTTGKFLLRTDDALEVESVLIPMQSGGTLCVSSQVGCRMGCAFCETGRMGLLRNLTTEEIVAQYFIARHVLSQPVRNVVFMGMGEPFDNFDNVMAAAAVLRDAMGCGLGRKNITISTSGCVEGIYKMIEAGPRAPNLAVSLNAPNDELRSKLMPVNRKHPLPVLYEAMRAYCAATGRQILLAYVLMEGQNDTLQHAEELVRFIEGLDVKINLIPYNHQSSSRFNAPPTDKIELFLSHLRQRGCAVLLRRTKGSKIMAACGQLGNVRLRRTLRQSPAL